MISSLTQPRTFARSTGLCWETIPGYSSYSVLELVFCPLISLGHLWVSLLSGLEGRNRACSPRDLAGMLFWELRFSLLSVIKLCHPSRKLQVVAAAFQGGADCRRQAHLISGVSGRSSWGSWPISAHSWLELPRLVLRRTELASCLGSRFEMRLL